MPSAARAEPPKVGRVRFHHGRDAVPYYVRTTVDGSEDTALHWGTDSVVLTPAPPGTTHLAGETEWDVLSLAADTWNRAALTCDSPLELSVGEPQAGEVGYDRVNRVVFREDRWCAPIDCDHYCGAKEDCPGGEECHDPGAAALTTLCFNLATGEILDADLEVNGVDFSISDNGLSLAPGRPLMDLGNTLTHEIGHVLGLDHTCWNPPDPPWQPVDDEGNPVPRCTDVGALTPEIAEATMYPYQGNGETDKRTLEADDVEGLCAIYPEKGCSCRVAAARGKRDSRGGIILLLFAVFGALRRPRRR